MSVRRRAHISDRICHLVTADASRWPNRWGRQRVSFAFAIACGPGGCLGVSCAIFHFNFNLIIYYSVLLMAPSLRRAAQSLDANFVALQRKSQRLQRLRSAHSPAERFPAPHSRGRCAFVADANANLRDDAIVAIFAFPNHNSIVWRTNNISFALKFITFMNVIASRRARVSFPSAIKTTYSNFASTEAK